MLVLAQLPKAGADEESHRKAVLEYFEITNQHQTYDKSIKAIVDAQIKGNPQMAPFKEVMLKFFSKYMSWDKIKPQMITLYTQSFTEEEIKQATAFFSTPTGRKFAQMTPMLIRKGAEIGQSIVAKHLPELRQMIMEKSKQLQEAKKAAPAAAAKKTDE